MGEFRLVEENMEKIRPHMNKVIKKSNEEAGCISYKFSEAIGDPGLIRVSEKWKSFEDLELHFKTEHMNNWRNAIKDFGGASDRDVSAYEVILQKEL